MVLVLLQFGLILALLLLDGSLFNQPIPLIVSLSGILFGFYTLLYNRLGNFNVLPELKENAKLITKGPYAYIRHPMYCAVLLMMFGVTLANITLISIVLYDALFVVLFLKAYKEENLWLKKDASYSAYKKQTKMFIPFLF